MLDQYQFIDEFYLNSVGQPIISVKTYYFKCFLECNKKLINEAEAMAQQFRQLAFLEEDICSSLSTQNITHNSNHK